MLRRHETSLAVVPYAGICAFTPKGNLQTGFRLFSHRSRGSFRLSFRVLVRYRTLDVFRLGRPALPCSAGNSGPAYSISVHPRVFGYGAVTLFGCLFQGASPARVGTLTAPHLSFLSEDIRLGLCPFRSPLLRVSLLLSFPAPTIMLYFRAFPFRVQSFVPFSASALAGFRRKRRTNRLPERRG